ncbi:MAG TPA: CHRD domain-containing protein [Myxococcota bacterium]|nr:CHRD domain-containing protein [Myxococcota bacterium]
MKRFAGTLGAFLGGCWLVSLVALPASAHEVIYDGTLSGSNESPANSSPALGDVLLTIDLDVLSMRVQASFSGLQGTSSAAHIHCCTVPGGPLNVGVATMLPTFTNFPLGVTSGTYDQTFDLSQASTFNPAFVAMYATQGDALNAFLNGIGDGAAYFNIHSSSFPGGEIRAYFHVVPEPQVLALLALGLGALAARRRA